MYGVPGQWVNCPTKVVWLTALFSNSEHFFVQLFVDHWPANTIWQQAKASNFIDRYIYINMS